MTVDRKLSEKNIDQYEAKLIKEKQKHIYLKKWIANDRMEALAVLLNLVFATAEYENNFEGLRQDEIKIPLGSRALLTLTTFLIGNLLSNT